MFNMSLLVIRCLLFVLPYCLAQSSTSSPPATQTLEPCGQISSLLSSYAEASPSATRSARFDVQLAQDCYDSVPLDQDDATNLIDGLAGMLEFQSDLEFLISPPPGYLLAGVDLQGELSDLRDQVTLNNITGEIDFETRITTILARAHDGHLTFNLDGLSILGVGRRTGSLVSVSLNSTDKPNVYLYREVLDYANGTGATPVAITQVNGVDVTDYILRLAQNTTYGSLQDPDALYNSFFWSWNDQTALGNSPGAFPGFVPAPFELFTNVTFANGSTLSISNYAVSEADFSSVVDGNSFYQSFLNTSAQTSNESASATASATETSIPTSTATESAPATSATSVLGYPSPTVISFDGALSGYFLDDPGFEDTAVLALRFMTEAAAESFQQTLTQFLNACRANNKQRLVIDVSGNPGGTVALAYDLIKQLFPSIYPYGAGNYRAHDGFRLLGKEITKASAAAQQEDPSNYTAFGDVGGTSDFDSDAHLDVDNVRFPDFASYYGPLSAEGGYGNYTNLTREDIDNINYDEATSNIVISGYGNMTNLGPQVFNNSNIILLSDGQCSSTCTIFSHFIKYQGKVKSIALGGRPTTGPMQAIGGIKGSEVELFSSLNGIVNFAFSIADNVTLETWSDTSLETIYQLGDYLIARTASKGKQSNELSFNFRNNIAEGDVSLTPLQFIYEAADCRLYYQPKHYLDITTIWKDAATQAFGINGTQVFSGCVAGSTDQPSSLSGDPDLYANGMLQNGTAVDIGAGISNQTAGTGNGTGGTRPFTGSAATQQASFTAIVGIVLSTVALLV